MARAVKVGLTLPSFVDDPEIGPGVVHRTIRSLQREYRDTPTTAAGHVSHSIGRGKLRNGPGITPPSRMRCLIEPPR